MLPHRPSRARRPRPSTAPSALLLALAACAPAGDGPELPPIQARAPVLELLTRPDLRRVEPPDLELRQDLVQPRGSGRDEYGAYPALAFRPPAELVHQVPRSFPDAVLRFALAVERGNYRGRGELRFELTLDGRRVLEPVLSCSADLPADERRWHRFELPIGDGGELRLRCTYEGDQETPPTVALGLLRVVVPYEVERLPARAGEPNVLLVVVDTLRADRLHAYGNARAVSPAMDALAERGLRFERAYSAAAWTVPSTASLLTGLDPIEHGLGAGESFHLADSIQTLAERFQRAGFTTGAFACNPLIDASRNFDQGFERFRGYDWPRAGEVLADVGEWLRANRARRFFLYVHLIDPHYPYLPTPESSAGLVGEPPAGFLEEQLDHHLPDYYAGARDDGARLLASRDHQLDLYDAEVLDADRAVGALFELLRELELERDTLVAVTSDHGEEFLEHGWAGHHNQLFDESVRVPLLLAGPGVPRGVVVPQPVENRRLAPTLLELAGLEAPRALRGRGLVGEAELERRAREPVFVTNSHGRQADFERRELRRLGPVHSVLHEGWRLIWSPPTRGEERELLALYDLRADPECRVDLAPEQPERAARLRALIERWLAEGATRRPKLMPATLATREMLEQLGYVGDG